MKIGDIVRIVNDSRPKGLVPDKYAVLLFQKFDRKWIGIKIRTLTQKFADHDVTPSEIFLIN